MDSSANSTNIFVSTPADVENLTQEVYSASMNLSWNLPQPLKGREYLKLLQENVSLVYGVTLDLDTVHELAIGALPLMVWKDGAAALAEILHEKALSVLYASVGYIQKYSCACHESNTCWIVRIHITQGTEIHVSYDTLEQAQDALRCIRSGGAPSI